MKRIASLMLVDILLVCACAFALNGTDYPAWDGASAAENSICGGFGGHMLKLDFDPSAEYSNLNGGTLQACFFAFDASERNYLEMYLQLESDISAGDVLTSDKPSSLTSVTLYEVAQNAEDIYFAGQVAGYAYPQGSSYEIHIEDVQQSAGSLIVRGTLSALLYRFDEADMPTGETLALKDLQFHFELPLNGVSPSATPKSQATPKASAAPAPTPTAQPDNADAVPRTTMDPHPAFTLPPDYRVI